MKIGLRILLGYFLIVGLAAWFLLAVFVEEVRPGVRATLEDTLSGTAHLLAAVAGSDNGALRARLQELPGQRVYMTDARGIVTFDSSGVDTGKDYSRWNDVYLTLQGKHGARVTRSDPADEATSIMYVAAPIREQGRITGVLTVAKALSTVQPFVERSQRKILRRGAVLLGLSLAIGIGFAWWLSRALRRLTDHVAAVEAGQKAPMPRFGKHEIGTLARAMEAMRVELEGKAYAEKLVHTLAHELKSPIAAIQGAAELLREDMPPEERRRFLGSILDQNARQRQLIDKILALVRVEQQQTLPARAPVLLRALIEQVKGDYAASLNARSISVDVSIEGEPGTEGDALLLRQALGNLLDNAIAFAPPASRIAVQADANSISVRDHGPGIPPYAIERIFERFYSLARPDGARSSGLGLPFVCEVMALHGGAVEVGNAHPGVCAVLRLHTERTISTH